MAVVNVLSSSLTNRDATPVVLSNAVLNGGRVRHSRAIFTITSGDNIGSTYRLFELPSNAVPISVRVSAPKVGTTTTFKLGLYDTTKNGGAIVGSGNQFGATINVNSGAIAKSEQIGAVGISNAEKAIWSLLALASDPSKNYDVVATLDGTADGTGTVLIEVDFAH